MPGGHTKKLVYVDMDGVLVSFPADLDDVDPSIRDECRAWCARTGEHHSDFEGLFATLPPADGAVAAIERLRAVYDVYLLSTAPWANTSSWSDKRRWVERHLPMLPVKHLILTHRKDLNRGDFLIDDRPNNGAREFAAHAGQEWIHFGSDTFPSWEAVLRYLQC